MIGKRVEIIHGKRTSCGKRVKLETYAEIYGLCKEGLVFGKDVTFGKGVMISPSSYYGGDFEKGFAIGDNSSIDPDVYVGRLEMIVFRKNVMIDLKMQSFR